MVSALARVLFSLKVIGGEYVPPRGGVIVAANHASYLDIPLLGCALKRKADFVGKSELFKNPMIGFFFRRLGGFPIRREGVDRWAIEEAVRRLKAGRLVVFYPEGRRSEDGQLQRPRPGVGMVAALANVPIVPALIEGTEQILPKQSLRLRLFPVVIKFGPPLNPSTLTASKPDKSAYSQISEAVMAEIEKLKNEQTVEKL